MIIDWNVEPYLMGRRNETMTNNQMRDVVSKVYEGQKWKTKVAAMPDSQIIAVYYRFMKEKKIK